MSAPAPRHRQAAAAGADREALEGGAAVAGLRRALVLAVEEEAHHAPALLGGEGEAERQLAVVDDGKDLAGVAPVLEHHVARPRRRRIGQQALDLPRRRASGLGRVASIVPAPQRGDLLQRHALLGEHRRDRAVLTQCQQVEAQPVVGLVTLGDQATPVGEHGAEAAEARIH